MIQNILNKDEISQSMRTCLGDKGRVSSSERARVYGHIGIGYAEKLEDVIMIAMLRGDEHGKEVISAEKLIRSFSERKVMDWVSILAGREDASYFITDARFMFDEITVGGWLAGADNERARRLVETGHGRLKQLEALMSSQKEGVTIGSREAPKS